MRTSRETDFRKLKITLVSMTYPSQRPQCHSLSPHVLLVAIYVKLEVIVSNVEKRLSKCLFPSYSRSRMKSRLLCYAQIRANQKP